MIHIEGTDHGLHPGKGPHQSQTSITVQGAGCVWSVLEMRVVFWVGDFSTFLCSFMQQCEPWILYVSIAHFCWVSLFCWLLHVKKKNLASHVYFLSRKTDHLHKKSILTTISPSRFKICIWIVGLLVKKSLILYCEGEMKYHYLLLI